ncbi:MAG: transporter [Edaphobacter sp.]|uniref:SphA family protein n=1 Tax=Edaphobacter sp. TaxID=1934404 RepID=UPI0023909FE0|nr:transporter [Edaphobacter sp.]MDE1178288.1 transporter [Edaphobacter sp.]
MIVLAIAACLGGTAPTNAQTSDLKSAAPQMPTVNLGLTSFYDGIAGPGWMVEEYGQGAHETKTIAADGSTTATAPHINSGSWITHVAYISKHRVAGAWVGVEFLVPFAYVDAGVAGQRGGIGDMTLGPLLLQWPEQKLFGMRFQQRILADFEVPTGVYTAKKGAVNIGSHAWTVHPYYAFTLLPHNKWETSWRISYLWNATDHAPVATSNINSTQAGQALHLNATLSYEVHKGVFVGANGYMFHQLTDSKVNGLSQPGTEVLGALGPGIMVRHKQWFYYANAYREFSAVDTTEGSKFVLRIERVF